MRKKFSFLIAASMFLLLLVPTISIAEIDDKVMKPGDTFIYTVSEFDVPWEDLFESLFANGETSMIGFPIENMVLDLSDSTFAVKVMGTDEYNGYYMLNPYLILGKDIEIPIPEDQLTSEVEAIFGDKLVIPEGVGFGMGNHIPGSDYLEFIDNDYEDYPGLPFYFDPQEWGQYMEMFEDFADQLDDADSGIDLTVEEKDDEFLVTIEGSVEGGGAEAEETSTEIPWWTSTYEYPLPMGGPDIDGAFTFEVAWHASGEHAGVFKRVNGNFDGDIGDANNLEINVEVSFKSKRYNPLPDEILNEETITLEMETASFTYDTTGIFEDNNDFQNQLAGIEDTLDDADGEDMFVFDVTDVEGCYYETDIEVYEGEDAEGVWWNGFVGAPGWKDDWMEGPWEDWYIYPTGGAGIIPLAAPGITPDWDMWAASTKAISSILKFVENAVTSSDAEDALADVGITLNTYDVEYGMRGNKDYKYFYFKGDIDLSFDSTKYVGWPSEDPEEPKADATVMVEAWLGYTAEGLILSIGLNIKVVASFEQFPFYSEYNEETYAYETHYDNGTLELELNAEIKNKDINDIPEHPTALPEDTEGEDVDGDGGLATPGFSIIPALILVAAISVIIKRRK